MAGVSTKEIKNRIRSMESTKQITKAMEMVAASKLRRAQAQVAASRPYFEIQSDVAETVDGGAIYTTICCIGALGIFIEVLGERLLQASGRTMKRWFA